MLEILHSAEYFRKNNSIHRKIVELKITKTLIHIIFQPAFQASLRRSSAEVIRRFNFLWNHQNLTLIPQFIGCNQLKKPK